MTQEIQSLAVQPELLQLELQLTKVSMDNCTLQAQLAQANYKLLQARLAQVQAQFEQAQKAAAAAPPPEQ